MMNVEAQKDWPMCPDRRKFLKSAGISAAALMGIGSLGCSARTARPPIPAPQAWGQPRHVAMAALAKGANEEGIVAATRRVAEAATDFKWLSKGDVVFIKPAANSPNPYPATTSPLAIRAVVGLLFEKGAGKVIVGDKSGVMTVLHDKEGRYGSTREVMKKIGLLTAAIESGAEVHYFDETDFDAYSSFRTIHPGHWKGELMLPNIVHQVDHIVLLPRVSRHTLAGTTFGLKAAVGWLRDDTRLELHRDANSFYEKLAEINNTAVFRQKLRMTLSIGTKVLSTYGPDSGYVTKPDPGLVFASESLLAHDMVALAWLLWNREFETPEGEISWYSDPYTWRPATINRGFIGYIWGLRQWYHTEAYDSVPILSARTDPVISRAAHMWGGLPRIELEDVGGIVPEKIRNYIMSKALA